MTSRGRRTHSWFRYGFALILLGLTLSPAQPKFAVAQTAGSDSRLFPETGKTVEGRFLEYWQQNGGLAQQGFPISDEMQERSDVDGKSYTVQYFERAVFEKHPENQKPYDVLLSLLGSAQYKARYGNAGKVGPSGPVGESPNNAAGSVVFTETGKRLGGEFLAYWQQNGGLAQQGYPISDEFQERSNTDGQTYKVQYFERAVFEWHPENQAPYNVLLSLLGSDTYKLRYLQPSATPSPSPTATAIAIATATAMATATTPPAPAPTNTPVSLTDCSGIPDNKGVDIGPRCAPMFTRLNINSEGWESEEFVGIWATMPNGQPFGAPFNVPVHNGHTVLVNLTIDEETPYFGVWTITMEGLRNHKRIYGYFKVLPYQPTPQPK